MFLFVFFSSFIMVLGGDDWFVVWMGLEINMLSFMLIMNKEGFEVESSLKYFFIQSLGSSILLLGFYSQSEFISVFNSFVLSYKMGGGPFYFWFPTICEGISWESCFFLMTFQKMLPMMIISLFSVSIIWFIGSFSLGVGVYGSFNQVNLKRLMAYSSIHHVGWLLVSSLVSMGMWILYLVMYSYMIMGLINIFSKNEVLSFSMISSFYNKMILILGMMSMGGIPPMLGFFMKWWVFCYLSDMNYFLLLFMILFSVIMMYIYFRLIYYMLMGDIYIFSWGNIYEGLFSMSVDFFYILGSMVMSLMILLVL